jgi:hypothetical protein
MMTSRSLDAIPATSDRAAIANTTIKKTTTTMGTTEEEGRRRRWRLVEEGRRRRWWLVEYNNQIRLVGRAAGAETGRFIGGHGAGRGEVVINDRVNGVVRCFGLRL